MSILQGLIAADQREATREQLRQQKRATDAELKMKGYDPETLDVIPGSAADVQQAQNQQVLQMANALQGKLAAQDTDNAILDYSQTGDASYLQKALDNNPVIKQAWNARGVKQVSNVDWISDGPMLERHGFNPAEYDTEEKQAILKKNLYKYYDGTDWKVGLLNNVVAETGALSRLGMNKGQTILDNFQQFRDFMAGPRSSPNTVEGHKYEAEITAASEATGVPGNLLAAMMNQESRGNPAAVSPKGASGLMQLMPETAKELGVANIKDPKENIMGGAKYMAQQLKKYNGDTRLALAAYNAGPGAVDKYNGIPPYKETVDYVTKIMNNYAAGESYYTAGADAVKIGQQISTNPTIATPDLLAGNNSVAARADNRIATIQNFIRSNANAMKGTTNENVDQEQQTAALEAAAKIQSNKVKLATDGMTAAQKDLAAAEQQTKVLVDNFGGEDAFFKTDFEDPKNFNKAWQQVVKINKLEGTELGVEDKKQIRQVRQLVNLAGPAAKLTSSQTGLIDNTLSGVSKYVSENANGIEAKAAMASFRNTLRHALFGSALTDGEITAFNEAFGTNKQKLGPVLEQFKVALSNVQSQIDTASRIGNPYTMKVMLGADQDKLAKIQTALQQRIDYLEGKYVPPKEQVANNDKRPSLDSIFSNQTVTNAN